MRRPLVATVALLALTACGQTTTTSPQAPTTDQAFVPVTIEHAMGRTEIKERPARVAALDTSYVDATLALETEVVAFTRYPGQGDEFPEYLKADGEKYGKNAKAIGDLMTPNLEELAGIAPDLIVSAKVRHAEIYDKLTKIGPTVFSETTGLTWKDNIKLLGKALGKEELANKKIADYEQRAKKVGDAIRAEEGRNPTLSLVRFVAGEQTVRLYTPNSFPGIVLKDTGLARPDGQPTSEKISVNLSQEQIISTDADRIFVSTWSDPKNESQKIKEQFLQNPLWSQLKGAKQDVSDTVWVASVSLQGAHGMLDDLAKAFGVDPQRS
ncbi:iron-siderophore ABC transporter substrate-binding protein [Lentzea tibetensis]|uniref:Iron-siderophore ABC transporter substrate-binding protein n=1 Tax=Lentzea tibetensis TaxID=2591470 RepID=A0A563EUI8_9PSEU|nr:iron-siderophore ABC transporter substrate-binding protein [Lentzea tibetensis]TWP51365.1 iron-siderophore ABC transporter substrate-binding protein [Lentzea tibetensis]